MEQVRDELNVATITKTARTNTKNYQKYFDVATTVRESRQVKVINYSRAKVVLITAYCVLALLVALAVTNFFLISSMSSSVDSSKITYQNEIVTSEDYANAINEVTNASAISERLAEAGYVAGEGKQVDVAPIFVATEASETREQTNWFNEFTKFISQVFGG